METIENIERAIDKIILVVTSQLSALNEIKSLLSSEALKGVNVNQNFSFSSPSQIVATGEKFNAGLYKGYPFEDTFARKMDFLDNIHKRAWRLSERRKLIIDIEGNDMAMKTLEGVTGKLQGMRKSGKWIGAKYGGVNKYTFHIKPEWLTEDGKFIKDAHCPPVELIQNLAEEKRKQENIDWLRK